MQKLYFDLETTGPDNMKDRIVQLGVILEDEDGKVLLNKQTLFNPEIPIKTEATEIHGITDDMVRNAPKFYEYGTGLKKLFEDKILVTYNGLHFDIPILVLSFERAGIPINLSGKFIDVLKIERKFNSMRLADTYRKYTGKELENAHDASADILATKEILDLQSKKYEFSEQQAYEHSGSIGMVDYFGKLKKNEEGFLVYNWGKHVTKRVKDYPGYVEWVIKEDFPKQVKNLLIEEINKYNIKKLKPII